MRKFLDFIEVVRSDHWWRGNSYGSAKRWEALWNECAIKRCRTAKMSLCFRVESELAYPILDASPHPLRTCWRNCTQTMISRPSYQLRKYQSLTKIWRKRRPWLLKMSKKRYYTPWHWPIQMRETSNDYSQMPLEIVGAAFITQFR